MNKKIDIEKLKAVRTIVTHDNCTDGLSAAILLHNVLPEAEIIFALHGTENYDNLEAVPNMLFVDIAPPPERVEEFVRVGSIVLDHHKGVKDIVEKFGCNAIFGDEKLDPGVSGGPLAYKYVWKPLNALRKEEMKQNEEYDQLSEEHDEAFEKFVARFAERAGIRDTWQRHNPEWYEATLQGEILYFWPREFWLDIRLFDIARLWEEKFHPVGSILMKKQKASTDWMIEESYRFSSANGTRILCFNSTRATSDVAEMIDKGADLIVGFKYKCETSDDGKQTRKIIFSTRSHTSYDCMSFCKFHGGGGHTKAAGFTWIVSEEESNIFNLIKTLVDSYEKKNPSAHKMRH